MLHPTSLTTAFERPRWKVSNCSVAGTRHVRAGNGCDDASGWFVAGELLCIAVADGAGSAPQAAWGSAVAVRAALLTLWHAQEAQVPIHGQSAPRILTAAVRTAALTVHEVAYARGLETYEHATTLILVLAGADFVASAQIGDGAVVLAGTDGDLITLSTPMNCEFANQTPLLGCNPCIDASVWTLPAKVQNVAVFTDGLQRLALCMKSFTPYAGFFRPLFAAFGNLGEIESETAIGEFLNSPRVNAKTDDDKTLVLAQRL